MTDKSNEPLVDRIVIAGVEVPLTGGQIDQNDETVARVVAMLDSIEEAETPAFIISTATSG